MVVESFNTPNLRLLPLADFFASDFSFLILPDVISDNMLIPFCYGPYKQDSTSTKRGLVLG